MLEGALAILRPAPIGERRLAIMNAILRFQRKHQHSPSVREIAKMVELTPMPTHYHLRLLCHWGYLNRERKVGAASGQRTLRVVRMPYEVIWRSPLLDSAGGKREGS